MMYVNRTIVTPPAADRVTRRVARRAAGSAIVLVVVSLVMIALLGMAYLQQVKMDRFTNRAYEPEQVDQVIAGILEDVQTRLTEDLRRTDSSGTRDGRPLYDYPWTDHGVTTEVEAVGIDGNIITDVSGSAFDDRHLATTAPLIAGPVTAGDLAGSGSADVVWPHLTNLGGLWVNIPIPGPGGAGQVVGEEEIDQDGADNENSDTGISHRFLRGSASGGNFLPRGFDADGDGIEDSRWTWAPPSVRTIDGKQYVMAVRIIDLSSMINVNTATRMTDGGPTVSAFDSRPGQRPRGYYPVEADLARLFARRLGGAVPLSGVADTELANLHGFRNVTGLTGVPDNQRILIDDDRETLWQEQASVYGDFAFSYGVQSELELRFLGGLNDTSGVAEIEAPASAPEPGMPQLLRSGSNMTDEQTWAHATNPSNPSSALLSDWFYGGDDFTEPVADRAFPGIRHLLTTASGAATFAPVLPFTDGDTDGFQLNLGPKDDPSSSSDFPDNDDIADALEAVFDLPGVRPSGGGNTAHYGDDFTGASRVADPAELAAEFAASILSYADSNSRPEAVTNAGTTFYGLDRLPFLRQVYLQHLYEAQDLEDAGGFRQGDPMFTSLDGVADTWVLRDNTSAIAVELANPFVREIDSGDLTDADIELEVVVGSAAAETVRLDDVSVPDFDPRNDTNDDDVVVLLANNNGTPGDLEDSDGDGADLGNGRGTGAQGLGLPSSRAVELTGAQQVNIDLDGATEIVLRLRADVNGMPMPQNYDEITVNLTGEFPNERDISGTPPAVGELRYKQYSAFRRSMFNEGINWLADDDATLAERSNEPWAASFSGEFDGYQSFELVDDDKVSFPTPRPLDDGFQLMVANRSGARWVQSVSELGLVSMVGFTQTETFTERLRTLAEDKKRLLLDIDSLAGVVVDPPTTGSTSRVPEVPHAALVFDLFTAVGVNDDGEDQDPDVDDDKEFFVRGKINVNTATLPVLTLAAPLPDANLDETEALMRTIIKYRDGPLIETSAANGSMDPAVSGGFNNSVPRTNGPFRATGSATPNFRIGTDRVDQPGIASLGELLFLNPFRSGVALSGDQENDMQRHGFPAFGTTISGSLLDLFPDPVQTTRPNSENGRESALARFQFLSQLFTVRSDRYAVYAVVRGYRAGAFDQGPVEEARFIAIIDRGSVLDPEEQRARVIGFVRVR